jgi:hypothetical protein
MSPEEAEAILNRPSTTQDPTLVAVIKFVEDMCDAATREATGFHTASVLNAARDLAKAEFINAMEKAAQNSQPSEG